MKIKFFTFSPFQENTYVLYDETGDCAIVDPGCYDRRERAELTAFIAAEGLNPVALWNTHLHIDHIFGNAFVSEKWGLTPQCHAADLPTLAYSKQAASMYGVDYDESPTPETVIMEGTPVRFGKSELEVRFTPGHAPGHVVFIHHESKSVINGDVLFQGSIGRSDLPGGDMDTLLDSIRTQLYTLPDDYTVYCGHGPETTIGQEKMSNMFVKG